ncbi:MAG: hypothetical protein IPJ47_21800 [Anaerolineales bacterium]|nr:hypothetical protein [Anaerolineales bacterium]
MKNNHLIVMALIVLTSACVPSIQPPTPRPFVAGISSTMTKSVFEATERVKITPTVTAGNPNPNMTATPDIYTNFRDDFDEKLQPGWEWINEDPKMWSLTNTAGTLQIQSEFGEIRRGSAKNVLLRSAPRGDFMVETNLNFSPDENDQFAGLVLFASETDFVQAGLGYCAPTVGCIKRGFYIDTYEGGKLLLPRRAFTFNEDIIFVRLVVQNGSLSTFTSPDGKVWYRTGKQGLNFTPTKIGLFTGQNSYDIIIPAWFGYFEATLLK